MSPSELRQITATDDVGSLMEQMGRAALAASDLLAQASTQQKNDALTAAAKAVRSSAKDILAANAKDMESARARICPTPCSTA